MTIATDTAGARARQELADRTAKSREVHEKGAEVLPIEVVPTFEMPTPIYIRSSEGATMTDVDGNEYIDLTMGFGPHVLGHRPEGDRRCPARSAHPGLAFRHSQRTPGGTCPSDSRCRAGRRKHRVLQFRHRGDDVRHPCRARLHRQEPGRGVRRLLSRRPRLRFGQGRSRQSAVGTRREADQRRRAGDHPRRHDDGLALSR